MSEKDKKTKSSKQKKEITKPKEEIKKSKKETTKPKEETKTVVKRKIYIDYSQRITLFLIGFAFFFALSILMLLKSLTFTESQIIEYTERSNLDYQVNLKENDFYETKQLEKGMAYIASLIDSVDIDFNYLYASTDNMDIDFEYDIIGKLVIDSQFKDKVYYEKEFILLNNQTAQMRNNKQYAIKEKVNIDYEKYNEIANYFKTAYGVDSESSFTVYLKIYKKTPEGSKIKIDDGQQMYITIPLSEKAVEITMDYQNISGNKNVILEENTIIDNILLLVISLISCIISIVFTIKSIRLISNLKVKKSKYDKYIKKLLTEYDRLIVEGTSKLSFAEKNIIKVNKFAELLDVRDTLNLPIIYNNIVRHQKCQFYIKHNDDIYLLVIKAVDLEEEKNEKA